jgi:hypothetical protein
MRPLRPNCKCARGELHGPYWHRFWREDPYALHKEYVRKADLAQVRAACEAYAEDVRQGRALILIGRTLIARRSRPAQSPLEQFQQLAYAQASLVLMDDMDDYFWAKKGSLRQRLAMFRLEEELSRLGG